MASDPRKAVDMSMDGVWRVYPSGPLNGTVSVAGSKNAATKHMVAALLGATPTIVDNLPAVGDVRVTAEMLASVGCEVVFEGEENQRVVVTPPDQPSSAVPAAFSGVNRIPILMIGPLVHLTGEVTVPVVGGDRIGGRPIDFHVQALQSFGADVEVLPDRVTASATRLHGTHIRLPYPSVGATESVLLTSVLAEGRTVLENAAIEPEIIELALFLQRMGARIELRPNRQFVIDGVERLFGARHRLKGDRIAALSYLAAGMVTGGRVSVIGCGQDRLVTAISRLRDMGAEFEIQDDRITAWAGHLNGIAVETDVHPGFMTDWQPILAVLAATAHGMSVIHETVYEERFSYIPALQQMGAQIQVYKECLGSSECRYSLRDYSHSAVIVGPTALHGADIEVPDIRAGFAYLLAASAASSPTTLTGVEHIERGYHGPRARFQALGLKIDEVPT